MRCPECEQRNSVAASKCKFCGAKFKRKSMPLGKKVALISAVVGVGGLMYLSMMLPKMVDPAEQLSTVAKRVAAGPKSAEDAEDIRKSFGTAVENMLKRYGSDSSTLLSKKLKAALPSAAFEVLVVDLPKGLKLVEIDTILQASGFMVMKGTNDTRVFPLPGFEVYDDARTVNDQAGPVIVLLGHTGGQLPHRPIVKTYALLPDSIVDDSKNMVPAFSGEGIAKFAKDSADITLDLSLASIAQLEKISMTPPVAADKSMRLNLRWKDAKYQPEISAPPDVQSYLLVLARHMKYPEYWPASAAYLGPSATRLLKENSSNQIPSVSILKGDDKRKSLAYSMNAGNKKFDMEFKKVGTSWQLAEYKTTEIQAPVAAASGTMTNTTVQPVEPPSPVAVVSPVPDESTKTQTSGTTSPPVNASKTAATLPPVNQVAVIPTPNPSNVNAASSGKANPNVSSSGKNTLPPNLISALPGPALGSSRTKNQEPVHISTKSATKSSGSTWLGDDDDNKANPDTTHHVAVVPPAVKKLTEDKNKKPASAAQKPERSENASASATSSGRIGGASGTVRLRSGPGLNARPVTEIPRGAGIQILGQEKGWYRVRFGNKTGYVFGPLVETANSSEKAKGRESQTASAAATSPATPNKPRETQVVHKPEPEVHTAAPSPSDSANAAVVRRPMNVRDDNRRKIGLVQPGDKIVVLSGMKNERYKVRLSNGKIGWVHKDALGSVSNQVRDLPQDTSVETPPEFVP